MNYRKDISNILILLLLISGCTQDTANENGGVNQDGRIDSNFPFTMSINDTVKIDSLDLAITFLDVPEDSRCPLDVVCVWEGRGVVELEIIHGTKRDIRNLKIPDGEGGYLLQDGYKMELTDLQPYPQAGKTIEHSDYRATIITTKQ